MSEEQQSVYDRAESEDLRAVRGPKLRIWDWVPGLLYNPKKVFLAVKVRGPKAGDFIIPLALVVVASMTLALVAPKYASPKGNEEAQQEHAVAGSAAAERSPAAESPVYGFRNTQEALNPIGWLMMFTMGFLWMAVIGSVVLFAIRIIGKQPLNFMGALALTGISAYALFIQLLFSLLFIFTTGKAVTADPATWFGASSGAAALLLMYLNPFHVFAIWLIGYGAHVVAKVEKQRAVLIGAVLWVIPVIIKGLGQLMA